MSDAEFEVIKQDWGKVYDAVVMRGRPAGFSYHLDIPKFVGIQDGVLLLTIPQIADTPIDSEWRDMLEQCACGARNALTEAIRFITGIDVRVEFITYDGTRRTDGVSDQEARRALDDYWAELNQEREAQARAYEASHSPVQVDPESPSAAVVLRVDLIPVFMDWPGTGPGELTVTAMGGARFASQDGPVTTLGPLNGLVTDYRVDQAGNMELRLNDSKLSTAGMAPVAMLKIHIDAADIPARFTNYLAHWGIQGVQQK